MGTRVETNLGEAVTGSQMEDDEGVDSGGKKGSVECHRARRTPSRNSSPVVVLYSFHSSK